MLLASYVAIRPGIQGVGNIAIRMRLDTIHTHSELLFEPGDGVDDLMPDGTTEPINNEYWCGSSVFGEKMPNHSKDPSNPTRRAGEGGGVRLKRIDVSSNKWMTVRIDSTYARAAAQWFVDNQGVKYDYLLIAKYALWVLPHNKDDRVMCSESVAAALGITEPHRIDPAMLYNLMVYLRDYTQAKDLTNRIILPYTEIIEQKVLPHGL